MGGGGMGGDGSGCIGVGGAGGMQLPQNQFLYVSNRDSNGIGIYRIGADGGLSNAGEVAASSPGSLALSPDKT